MKVKGVDEGGDVLSLSGLAIADNEGETAVGNKISEGDEKSVYVPNDPEEVLYRVTKVPGKGDGVVAARDLMPGTVISIESPLIVIDGNLTNMERIGAILQCFGDLSQKDQVTCLSIFDPEELHTGEYLAKFPEFEHELEMRKVVRIFDLNAYEVCSDPAKFGICESGLYPRLAKTNHSCAPNVLWSWDKQDASHRMKLVTVCREIKEGEEIVISYLQLADFPSRQERQDKLAKTWYFDCGCKVCSLEGEDRAENERIRSQIRGFDEQYDVLVKDGMLEKALEGAKEKVRLMKIIKDESTFTLPFALLEVCDLASHLNLVAEAKEAKEEALAMITLFGDRHLDAFQWFDK